MHSRHAKNLEIFIKILYKKPFDINQKHSAEYAIM